MSSEILGGAQDVLKGNLGGAWDVKHGYADAYTDLGIARKFGGAAAAYSLRDIGAMNGPVVRVRRESDNAEADFSASGVPFIADWVNRQTVKPLDIQALNSGGSGVRDGDFQIASAAYSLRSLGTRQATVSATGDTITAADGKYVVQVRRSRDNTIKSFTADEVSDGTLVSFVTEPSTGWNTQPTWNTIAPSGTIRSQSSTSSTSTLTFFAYGTSHTISDSSRPSHILVNEGDVVDINLTVSNIQGAASVEIRDAGTDTALDSSSTIANGTVGASFTVNSSTSGGAHIVFSSLETPSDFSDGTITINSVTVTGKTGFVRTWYDQSVTDQGGGTATGNHAIQATAAEQPKIVSSGALILQDSKPTINFDTSSKTFGFSSSLALSTTFSYFNVFNPEADAKVLHAGSSPRIDFENSNPDEVEIVSNSFGGSTKMNLSKNGFLSTQNLFSLINVSTAVSVFDGGTASSENPNTVSGSFTFTTLGGGAVQNHQELIVYATDQTDNRGAYEGNMADHYGITGVPTGANTVNGFVETWYDQSGNGRDSTQTTAARQPIIVESGTFQDGLKFTHTDTTNGKRMYVPRNTSELGTEFALVWVGKITQSESGNRTLLGGIRNVQGYNVGSVGITNIASSQSIRFTNEKTTTSQQNTDIISSSYTINEDFVAFANYDDDAVTVSVDDTVQTSTFSSTVLTSTADLRIMAGQFASGATGGIYRTQESPTGICKEVLVYDTNQSDNRPAIVTNINNKYSLF